MSEHDTGEKNRDAIPTGEGDTNQTPAGKAEAQKTAKALRKFGDDITHGSILTPFFAVVLALLIGAILIALSNTQVQHAANYFWARPGDTFSAIGHAVGNAYSALFQGSVFDLNSHLQPQFHNGIEQFWAPLTDTLNQATPLIIGGLGLGIGFRAGLFNIGGQGQIIAGGIACGWVSFGLHMPAGIHLVAAVAAAIIGGAIWGFIPGILKATTGANEVITTIMLNYVALQLVAWVLTFRAFQNVPGQPQSPLAAPNSRFPHLFGGTFTTDLGFLLAIAAAFGVWWLMERSTLGFRLRAVGANQAAANTAGIKSNHAYMWCLVIGGALLGLLAATQLLGASSQQVLSSDIAGTFGFDAITVALLGRNKPLGTVLAGLLFGALKAGGYKMQLYTPIDVVLVLESVIVLFIAAPPLVKAIFHLPDPGRKPSRRTRRKLVQHDLEVTA